MTQNKTGQSLVTTDAQSNTEVDAVATPPHRSMIVRKIHEIWSGKGFGVKIEIQRTETVTEVPPEPKK